MADFIQILVVGISTGFVFGIVGLSFTAIFNASGIVNFAQGEFTMLGAVLAYAFITSLQYPLFVSLVAVIACMVVIGLMFYFFLAQPLMKRKAPLFTIVIGTLALSTIIGNAAEVATSHNVLRIDHFLGFNPWILGDIRFTPQNIIIIGTGIVLVLAFWLLLNKTIYGIALRATGFNKDAASLMGIRSSTMIALAFAVSAGISGVAGFVVAPVAGTSAAMGLPLVIKGFVAAVIGGLGNPYAAVVGGIGLGVISSMFAAYVSSEYADVAAYMVLILVLLVRPHGLFGSKT